MEAWRVAELLAEAKKAGNASEKARRLPKPPLRVGRQACANLKYYYYRRRHHHHFNLFALGCIGPEGCISKFAS
jgi:hypothetical protein